MPWVGARVDFIIEPWTPVNKPGAKATPAGAAVPKGAIPAESPAP